MKFGVIIGSHRKDSQSLKVGKFISQRIEAKIPQSSVYVLNLGQNPLPLWDESIWEGAESWKKIWSPYSNELKTCDAFFVISPEYSGMSPAGLKNLFLLCDKQELAHKPAALIGVSSGISGSYPIVELRSSSYKNTRICYIPDHIIIREVQKYLNTPEPDSAIDKDIRERVDYTILVLEKYAQGLALVRNSGIIDTKRFPFGM